MKSVLLIILGCVILVSFYSCERRHGCREKTAINYDKRATVDDESCVFKIGSFLYWKNTHQYFIDKDIETISVYVNGELVLLNLDVFAYDKNNMNHCTIGVWPRFEITMAQKSYYWTNQALFIEAYDQSGEQILGSFKSIAEEDYFGCAIELNFLP